MTNKNIYDFKLIKKKYKIYSFHLENTRTKFEFSGPEFEQIGRVLR